MSFMKANLQTIQKVVLGTVILMLLFGAFAVFNTGTAFAQNPTAAPGSGSGCSSWFSNFFGSGPGLVECAATAGITAVGSLLNVIGVALYALTGWLLSASGWILNLSIQKMVVDMSTTVQNLDAVEVGWVTFRDLANMAFIFVLVFSAIATILQISTYGAQRLLPKIIIVALLLNFSFFFAGIVIDATNIVAVHYATSFTCTNSATNVTTDCGLATAITDSLDLHTTAAPQTTDLSQILLIFLFTVLASGFLVVTAFVLFIMAILLVTRFVVLVFVLVLSPIAFVSMILPGSSISKKWWSTLINQAIFAPLFFILIWFVLSIISSPQFKSMLGPIGPFTDAFNVRTFADEGIAQAAFVIVLNFIVVTAFLIGALVIAKSYANSGGAAVQKLTSFATKAATGVVFGAGAYAMRNTAGRVANSGYAQRAAARMNNVPIVGGLVGGAALAGVSKMAKGSYDVRHNLGGEYGRGSTGGGFAGQQKRTQERKALVGDLLKDKEFKDKNAEKEARAQFHSAVDDEQMLSNTDRQKAQADRAQREKDIDAKNAEIEDAKREARNAERMLQEAKTDPARQAARNLQTSALQKQERAELDKKNLVAGGDAILAAKLAIDEAARKTISGREYMARKQDVLADRFGGKDSVMGRLYDSATSQGNAAKTAKVIRTNEQRGLEEKVRDARAKNNRIKTGLEAQKAPVETENNALKAQVADLEKIRSAYGAGADLPAKQSVLITRQQDLSRQIDEAINVRGDRLAADRLRGELAPVQEELNTLSRHLGRFGATANIQEEVDRRQARIASNEVSLQKIHKEIADLGDTKTESWEDKLDQILRGQQGQNSGGGTTTP